MSYTTNTRLFSSTLSTRGKFWNSLDALYYFLIVSVFASPESVNSPSEPLRVPPTTKRKKKKKKTKPGLSSRISSQDQPETSFLPLIRNSGLLPTLPLASVSPWYVPQDNPLVSLRFPLQWAFPEVCSNIPSPKHGTSQKQLTYSSKFSGNNEGGQGEGKVPFSPTRGEGEGADVLQLGTKLESLVG